MTRQNQQSGNLKTTLNLKVKRPENVKLDHIIDNLATWPVYVLLFPSYGMIIHNYCHIS